MGFWNQKENEEKKNVNTPHNVTVKLVKKIYIIFRYRDMLPSVSSIGNMWIAVALQQKQKIQKELIPQYQEQQIPMTHLLAPTNRQCFIKPISAWTDGLMRPQSPLLLLLVVKTLYLQVYNGHQPLWWADDFYSVVREIFRLICWCLLLDCWLSSCFVFGSVMMSLVLVLLAAISPRERLSWTKLLKVTSSEVRVMNTSSLSEVLLNS